MSALEKVNEYEFKINPIPGVSKVENIATAKTLVGANNCFSLLLDMDEVIVNISDKWLHKIYHDERIRPFFTDKMVEYIEKNISFNMRKNYYIFDELGINILDNKKECDIIYSHYFDDENFYDDLNPTPYFRSVLQSIDFIESITIISVCGTSLNNGATRSKSRWLYKYFSMIPEHVEKKFFLVPNEITKGQIVKDNNLIFNSYVEDKKENIVDVLMNTNFSFEILIPMYGYNYDITVNIVKIPPEKLRNRKTPITLIHNLDNMNEKQVIKNLP